LIISGIILASAVSQLFASVDPELMYMVPEKAKLVASVDVRAAKNSEVGRYCLNQTQHENRAFSDFYQETGFDPRRDVDYVLFESSGQAAPGFSSDSWSMLVRGTFDPARIRSLASRKGAVIQNVQGVTVISDRGKGGRTSIAFPEVGIALIGDPETVQEIILNRATPTQFDSALKLQIDNVGASNDLWFATVLGGGFLKHEVGGSQAQPQAGRALESVLRSSGGIRLGAEVGFTFNALTRSPEDAQALADVVRFLASAAQSQQADDAPQLAAALANLNVVPSGSSIQARVTVPEKTVQQLFQPKDRAESPRTQPAQ
jgi:hypothetical protein